MYMYTESVYYTDKVCTCTCTWYTRTLYVFNMTVYTNVPGYGFGPRGVPAVQQATSL